METSLLALSSSISSWVASLRGSGINGNSSTTEEEARLESMHVQHGIVAALLKLERCQPVMRLEQINFLKSVVQDKYRSIESPGALMLEILASFELEYQEQFYV